MRRWAGLTTRRLLTSARSSACTVSVSASTTSTAGVCLLCDASFSDWQAHCSEAGHAARQAISGSYVSPERHAAIMSQLWDHIRLDFSLVDSVAEKKNRRRRVKLAGTMRYLAEQGVLRECLPVAAAADGAEDAPASICTRGAAFRHYVDVGASYLTMEATERIARLMPRLPADELAAVLEYCLSLTPLRVCYETVMLGDVLDPDGVLPPAGRVEAMLAALGELRVYTAQERSHAVTNKMVADALVLNVLAGHCTENLVSELIHTTLQRVVDECTPVWAEYVATAQQNALAQYQREPGQALAQRPRPSPKHNAAASTGPLDPLALLASAADAGDVASPPLLRLRWSPLLKGGSVEAAKTGPATIPKLIPRTARR